MQYLSQNVLFSRYGSYRYRLQRRWHRGRGSVLFVGLNPYTADCRSDDPTVRRCATFARDWGYAEMEMVNLFAYRTRCPRELKRVSDPIGPENDCVIEPSHRAADLTVAVACWGNTGAFMDRAASVAHSLSELHCLKWNCSGEPAHPLYLKAGLRPQSMPRGNRKETGS